MTVTEELIKSKISKVDYWNTGKTTVCIITLKSGFEVVGSSAPVDKNNFNKELGEKYAYEKAFDKLWELEGYLLQNTPNENTKKSIASDIMSHIDMYCNLDGIPWGQVEKEIAEMI